MPCNSEILVNRNLASIESYLNELSKNSRKRYEAKLLILGDGNEGKTCVSRALRGLPFEPQVTTKGVEVDPWTFAHPKHPNAKKKNITLNIWDFEGQEIHHQTHQFFLTENSLYLIVFKCRDIFQMERAEYWLDTIRSRAPHSRVFLVISQCEERTPYLQEDVLKEKYGDLLQGEDWYFPVGCSDISGVPELQEALKKAAAAMKNMGMNWPQSYTEVEKAIKDRAKVDEGGRAHLGRAELYDIFKKKGIDKGNYEFLASHFGETGVITHFPECPDLYDFVVIKPQWLTKAISLVLEDPVTKLNGGKIKHENLRKIWEKDYPGLYNEFHDCMEEFELCYDLENTRSCLIPLRFKSIKPEIPWSPRKNYKERRVKYELNIRPPMGIMSRLIVKTHHWIAKTDEMPFGVYWHNGVFLRKGEGDNLSEALCSFNLEKGTLYITVRAAFPQGMIEQLHGVASSVFNFFKGLRPKRYYGCLEVVDGVTHLCDNMHTEDRISYAILSDKKTIDCEIGLHDVDPRRILTGFTSFGEMITMDKIRKLYHEQPRWANSLIENMDTLISESNSTSQRVNALVEAGKSIPASLKQIVDLGLQSHLKSMDRMLDNRDFNSAPGIVSITPVDRSNWNPDNWFNKEYTLTPYCECGGEDTHIAEDAIHQFKMPKKWWRETAPKLSIAFKVLTSGVQIATAAFPLVVGGDIYNMVKYEVGFMKALSSQFQTDIKAESDVRDPKFVEENSAAPKKVIPNSKIYQQRIARNQLAKLFKEIAPEKYESRQWGSLRRVRMPDDTYRWLCPEHAEKLR